MKRPTWATVAGVLGIIFGCFGIMGAGQEIMMPAMLKFQKKMFSQMEGFMQQEMAKENAGQLDNDDNNGIGDDNRFNAEALPFEMFKSFERLFNLPTWFNIWCVIGGLLKLIISGLLLFAAIAMLQLKPFSISLFYWATGLGIFLTIVKSITLFFALSFLGFIMMFGGLFGIVIDIVLLIVVITGDKEAFGLRKPFTLTY